MKTPEPFPTPAPAPDRTQAPAHKVKHDPFACLWRAMEALQTHPPVSSQTTRYAPGFDGIP